MTRGARFGLGAVAAVGVLAALLFLRTSRWALLLVEWIRELALRGELARCAPRGRYGTSMKRLIPVALGGS